MPSLEQRDEALSCLDLYRQVLVAVSEDDNAVLDMSDWLSWIDSEESSQAGFGWNMDYAAVNNGYGEAIWDGIATCNTVACMAGWMFANPGVPRLECEAPSTLASMYSALIRAGFNEDPGVWARLFDGMNGRETKADTVSGLLKNVKVLERVIRREGAAQQGLVY